jgi:hypothetical protein
MASPAEKLAQSLEELKRLQNDQGFAAVRTANLSRTHLERLVKERFLAQVIKGWYLSTRPDSKPGSTSTWYSSFWYFISVYLNYRFGNEWCLSPEQSMHIHSGNWVIPSQLLVRSPKGSNNRTDLLHGTSLFDVQLGIPPKNELDVINGINIYSLASSIINIGEDVYKRKPIDTRTCYSSIKDSSEILSILLEGGNTVKAGRVAGAFRNIGNSKITEEILSTMISAGYDVRETDPYTEKMISKFNIREVSPFANRIKLMWNQMRPSVIETFPAAKSSKSSIEELLIKVDEKYVSDAYNSLSIEGYRVTEELINKVKTGDWDPKGNEDDLKTKNALAARGYWQCFQKVKEGIADVLRGENPGAVADSKHVEWYRELFSPSVASGILKPSDLAGYRNAQVFISGSMHTPPGKEAVRDAMPVLFELLEQEENVAVRAILGHFIFVYIHPYMDGNGRIARFLMNLMFASGGYSWLIIPVEKRNEYMEALESASVDQDISKFANFIASLIDVDKPEESL